MKYAVDKIEGNIAVIESLEDKTKKEVLLTELPENIKEGTILIKENEVYLKDEILEQQRKNSIQNKFDMLRKRKVDNN